MFADGFVFKLTGAQPMYKDTRRGFVKSAAAIAGGICTSRLSHGVEVHSVDGNKSDIRIERVSHSFEEHAFRTPLKFALAVVNRQTMLTVNCTVRTAAGKVA